MRAFVIESKEFSKKCDANNSTYYHSSSLPSSGLIGEEKIQDLRVSGSAFAHASSAQQLRMTRSTSNLPEGPHALASTSSNPYHYCFDMLEVTQRSFTYRPFYSEMHFVNILSKIGTFLLSIPDINGPAKQREMRNVTLRIMLKQLNQQLFVHSTVILPVYPSFHVLGIVHEEAVCLNSRERVPYMLVLEVKMSDNTVFYTDAEDDEGSSRVTDLIGADEDDYSAHQEEPEEQPTEKSKQSGLMLQVYGERWKERGHRIWKTSSFHDVEGWRLISFIVKSGDDLRQEQLAMQLITQFSRIFLKTSLPIWLRPYLVISTGQDSGLIETVPDSTSLDTLKKKCPDYTSITNYFISAYGDKKSKRFIRAQTNFIESLAGYSLICYFLQIKDSPGSINFESAPFKLTQEFVELMGGQDSDRFLYFKTLLLSGFIQVRKHYQEFLMMIELMLPCTTLSCLSKDGVLERFKSRFRLDLKSDDQCQELIEDLVSQSVEIAVQRSVMGDSRLDVNSLGLTSTLISKLFESLSTSLDATLSSLINDSLSDRLSSAVMSPHTISSSTASLRLSKSNTLIRKLASSSSSSSNKIVASIDQQANEKEWTNFARNFWFYYPSLLLISESAKHCKASAIRLVLEFLPRHISQLQSHSAPIATGGATFSAMMSSNINLNNSNNNNSNTSGSSTTPTGSVGRATMMASGSFSPGPLSPSTSSNSTPSLVTVLSSNSVSATKAFSFETFLSSINCHIYQTDLKYLDLIESTVEIVVADIITQILGKFDTSSSSALNEALLNRLRDLAFYYFKPIAARSLNLSTWISLRTSISDQWSLILGQISRISLVQLEALDGMMLSMNDYTISTGIVEKMKLVYKRAEKLLKHDEFEERSLKLMTTILTRGPNSVFEEEYEGVLKRLWKTLPIQKKRDFSLECLLRLLQGRFVPPRKIIGLQAHLSANSDAPGSSIAAQLQQRMDRVYENSGSYLYAGLANNRAKMTPRLQELITVLYGKKIMVPKVIECIDLLTAINVHMAVHSLKLLTDSVLPSLFSSTSPIFHVIALRTLSIILDPSDVFWNTSPSANSARPIVGDTIYVRKEEIHLTFETFLTKSFKFCQEQAGGESALTSQDPLTISTQFEPTISLYSLISDQTSVHKFESETTVEAIKRWYDVCTKTSEQREREFFEQSRVMSVSLMSKVLQWEHSNSLGGIPSEMFPARRKMVKRKMANVELLELFKETIRCITFVPRAFIMNSTLHKLVLHEEEEIAVAASHAIQVIMCDHPEFRTSLVQGYTSLTLQYVGKDHVALQTLLSQLLGLIDLWNERSFIESRHSSVPLDSSFYPPKMLETEIEAIGLVHLVSPSPAVRMIALQLIRSISGIRNTETTNTQVASVLHTSWRTIVQRARHQLLLDNACGIDVELKLNANDELPSIEELACATHDRFWAFVLSEIGRAAVEHDCVRTLSKTRGILLNIIANMPPVPTEVPADDGKRHAGYMLRHLWVNSHALLFSLSGIASHYPLRIAADTGDANIDDMIAFEHTLQSKVTNYLPTFWAGLLSDFAWTREKLSFICGLLHWRLLPCVIDSLNRWWMANKTNKKLARVRVDVSNIFRRISQHKEFARALAESTDLVQVFVQFIQQIDPIFGDPTKLPSVQHESYFNDNAVVVHNFCNSLYTPTPAAMTGPIRKALVSSMRGVPWTVGERYKTFKALLQWSGHAKVAGARMQLEGVEINKRLAKAKDSFSRDEEKERIEAALKKIRSCSRLAAEAILRLGTLFEEGRLAGDVLEWVVDSEKKGNRILRWVLSYHFDEAYGYFLTKSYGENPAESVLYLHSLYDQYLPIPANNPPTRGITVDIYQFYFERALEERAQEELEDVPLTAVDRNFARRLTEIGASLLFLSCLNLLHPAHLARIRSFDLIARLSPCAFGLMLEENPAIRAELLPRRQSFASKITPTFRNSAVAVSQVVARAAAPWTERLFEEAFNRFGVLSPANRRWVVQFLLPWCGNISLVSGGETRMKIFTPIGFLKAFFTQFTESLANSLSTELPTELIDLWLALAKREPANLTAIVSFLIKKGIASKESMPICKLIVLHLYRVHPVATLEPLISHLSYAGVVNERKSDESLSSSPENAPPGGDAANKKASKAQSVKTREACVLIISDLISEDIDPIMPHLHILFNYSLLRIDSATEAGGITKMINLLLSALRNHMYAHMDDEDAAMKPSLRSVLKSIDTILTSLRLPTFQIKFDLHDGKKEVDGIILDGTSSLIARRNRAVVTRTQPPTTPLSTSKDDIIEHRNEMIKWCNGFIYVDELIAVLCKYFELMTPATIDRWEAEALLWIKNYKDPRISIKACQTYRSIIHCQQQLPGALNNISKTSTLRRQKTRWASSVEHLVSLLQEWAEDLDANVASMVRAAEAQSTKMIFETNGIGAGSQATFNRTLCVEILLALKQIVESKNIDEMSTAMIFWAAIAFLPPLHRFYEPLYDTSLSILSLLVTEHNVLANGMPAHTAILARAAEMNVPRGIQYHLFKGILSPRTEEVASRLIIAFCELPDTTLVDPLGPPQRYIMPVIALTPWLHNKILTSKSSIVYKEQKVVADVVASRLEASLTGKNQVGILAPVFAKYSAGAFNSNPDDFLISVVDGIRSLCIPAFANECADLIGNMLDSSQLLSTSILKTTNCLLKGAPIAVMPLFKNIVRMACECGSSSPVAGELIHLVGTIMKTASVSAGILPPPLVNVERPPSHTIKILIGAKSEPAHAKRGRGHRRNKSAITDHPSLKEKATAEKKLQPAATPRFSNVFNNQMTTAQMTAAFQQQQQQVTHLQPPAQHIPSPSSPSPKDESMPTEEDFDFEFGDDDELADIMQEDDPSLTMSMQKALWRNSDEYNVYLDAADEDEFEGLGDLKDGLDGIDTNSLLSKLNPTQSMLSINIPETLQQQHSSPAKSLSSSTIRPIAAPAAKPEATKTVQTPRSTTATNTNTNTQSKAPTQAAPHVTDTSVDSLRALLHSSDNITMEGKVSDSFQIDQLLNNLADLGDDMLDEFDPDNLDDLSVDSPLLMSSLDQYAPVASSLSASQLRPKTPTILTPADGQATQPAIHLTGIRSILADSKKRRAFLDFLKKRHFQKAVNDVCFVEVVHDFKSDVEGSGEVGGDGLLYLMKHIVEGFVAENARHSISITEKIREEVVKAYQDFISNGNNIDPTLFDVALDFVIKALEEKSILDEFLKVT
eukprot:gene12807-15029_t